MEEQGASSEHGVTTVTTPFKRAQLRHRRHGDNPYRTDDIDECLDFHRYMKGGDGNDDRIIRLTLPENTTSDTTVYRGPMFGIRNVPGFLFAPQALGADLQKELAHQSVTEYCEAPHKTNIDQSQPKEPLNTGISKKMWDLWKEDNHQKEESNKKKNKKHKSIHSGKQIPHRCFQKLSWATMGFHYDWTARSYNEAVKSHMPRLVHDLSTMFARTSLMMEGASNHSFEPTASIVNFYSTKSFMGGHRDDLELAIDKPIVSVSVGLPAIFLLGGKTKDDEPVLPIVIRSGDVLCMGGDCRLNYHGMARLLPSSVNLPFAQKGASLPEQSIVNLATFGLSSTVLSNEDSECLDAFLADHRLNINVRQVYPVYPGTTISESVDAASCPIDSGVP